MDAEVDESQRRYTDNSTWKFLSTCATVSRDSIDEI